MNIIKSRRATQQQQQEQQIRTTNQDHRRRHHQEQQQSNGEWNPASDTSGRPRPLAYAALKGTTFRFSGETLRESRAYKSRREFRCSKGRLDYYAVLIPRSLALTVSLLFIPVGFRFLLIMYVCCCCYCCCCRQGGSLVGWFALNTDIAACTQRWIGRQSQ